MLRNCNTAVLKQLKSLSELRLICTSRWHLKGADDEGSKDNDAATRLNALLLSIAKEDKKLVSENTNIKLPKPRVKMRSKKSGQITDENKNLGSKIVDAAKTVASHIKGDDKEIEAQLLHKLLYKGSPVKEELLKSKSANASLTELLSKMTVEKEEPKFVSEKTKRVNEFSRAAQVRNLIGKRPPRERPIPRRSQRVDLFSENPLGLFDLRTHREKGVELKTWTACEEREKRLSVAHPPSNYFEQMIDWTEKGIIWKFPIDNEQGMDKEKGVSFASHVLLETHLDGWCPPVGPIRHFMELVCIGLSRNHWLSADEKEQHIFWYKEFFIQRRQLILELGAGEMPVGETK